MGSCFPGDSDSKVSACNAISGLRRSPGGERGSPALQVDSIPAELSLTVLGPCCCVGFSPVAVSECYSLVVMQVCSLQWLLLLCALEHSQHGEGEVVEIGDAVLGPIPAWFAHRAILALPPVTCLQGTGRGVVFCWDISSGQGKR